MPENKPQQRDTQPTSLTDALAKIDRVEPVEPAERKLAEALGCTLAADAGPDNARRLTGARLRRTDIALLASVGVERVAIRVPRVLVVHSGASGNLADSLCTLIAGAIEGEGGIASIEAKPSDAALNHQACDAVIAIGGEENLRLLANLGQIEFEGIALKPAGSIAFGNANARPVLLLPETFEPALAAWLTLGRRLIARLAFRLIEEQPYLLELARPVTSSRGTAEIIPVRRRAAQVEPLTGDWTAQTIARADGWILVPTESDGFPAGTRVQMRLWP
jgi:molybdopterin molybdotransferase